ncbi:MAG: hypothetical protein EBR09_15175 [Proteobacteria bacterium]|nr:hypothetical protein [Pseudomonadota bacterium]
MHDRVQFQAPESTSRGVSACIFALSAALLAAVTGCSGKEMFSAGAPLKIKSNELSITVSEVPLSGESRLAGYLPKERRLIVLNTASGEESWSSYLPDSDEDRTASPVRDGVVLRDSNFLRLFLMNGGQSVAPVTHSYATGRLANETQFVVTYDSKSEVINLLENDPTARTATLPHNEALFPLSETGARLKYTQHVHSFFTSATNDSMVSLDLLQLKFSRFQSTGTDLTGATRFSATQSQLCIAADLNRVGQIDDSTLPVAYALSTTYEGVLIRKKDGRLIFLHFAKACSGENALRIFQPAETPSQNSNSESPPIPVGPNTFAIQGKDGRLDFFDVSQDPVQLVSTVPAVCEETLLGQRLYNGKLLIVCGRNAVANSRMLRTVSKHVLLDTTTFQIELSHSPADTSVLAGFALDNRVPKVFTLSNSSLGRLTSYEFVNGGVTTDVKSNMILKNILNKL